MPLDHPPLSPFLARKGEWENQGIPLEPQQRGFAPLHSLFCQSGLVR
jgi:hypothetical protein